MSTPRLSLASFPPRGVAPELGSKLGSMPGLVTSTGWRVWRGGRVVRVWRAFVCARGVCGPECKDWTQGYCYRLCM
eukprot:5958186-Pyramimonas_sp.AAC.1